MLTLVGWYPDPSSGRYALRSRTDGEKTLLMDPDLLPWHDGAGEYVLDIVEPHRHDLGNTAPKWAAFARYAENHAT